MGGAAAWVIYTATLDLTVAKVHNDAQGRIEIHRRPVGVVASMTPGNWPLRIAVWHASHAIRAGNTVVIKPSPLAPLSTRPMLEIMAAASLPGVRNVVS